MVVNLFSWETNCYTNICAEKYFLNLSDVLDMMDEINISAEQYFLSLSYALDTRCGNYIKRLVSKI